MIRISQYVRQKSSYGNGNLAEHLLVLVRLQRLHPSIISPGKKSERPLFLDVAHVLPVGNPRDGAVRVDDHGTEMVELDDVGGLTRGRRIGRSGKAEWGSKSVGGVACLVAAWVCAIHLDTRRMVVVVSTVNLKSGGKRCSHRQLS